MVDYETKTAAGKTCFVSDSPDEGPTKWGDDEDTPDRPFTADDVDARASFRPCKPPADPCASMIHGCACSIARSVRSSL